MLDAFALAIIASEGPPAYPGLPGHEPDLNDARRNAKAVAAAMAELAKIAPHAGSYVAESGYFEADWQTAYWGANYARLHAVKGKYDPTACSSFITASAAKHGAPTVSRVWPLGSARLDKSGLMSCRTAGLQARIFMVDTMI